ncbi:MAG: hypothetical protein EA384_14700 [Spirochaetaceae bacterium]|nr:MAG: hypothetical protein EA384_14700 [Spirochaetaceae bacterium]
MGVVLTLVLLLATPVALSAADPPATASEAVDRFEEVYRSIHDYQVRLYQWCRSGRRYERRIIDFYFKRPRRMRMDILTGNRPFDDGSVGLYLGGDKVVGRKGGILSAIVLTVNKYDAIATTVRGVTFDQSDLQGILDRLRNGFTIGEVELELRGGWYWLHILPHDPEGYRGVTRETVAFDPQTFLPIYSETFEGELQVEFARWTDYILNAGLPDELFRIRTESSILRSAGIRTIHGLPADETYFAP